MRKRVFTNGCFDVLTAGHVAFLEKAATLGCVTVGVNDDEAVRKLKGPTRPINNEMDRLFVVRSLNCVANSYIIRSTNVAQAILDWYPDIWVKGGDYTLETLNQEEVAAAKEVGAEIVILPLKPGYSTTETLRRMQLK